MTGLWLDTYEREARLLAGLLTLAPILVAALGFGVPAAGWPTGIASGLIAVIGPAILTKFVRNRGVTLEEKLFARWGGPPTTLLLQRRPGEDGAVLTQRRAQVERATGVTLPEGAGEDCHEGYHAAVLVLRSRTNDQNRFRTVHAENRGYGFERNLLGIRTEGLVLSTVAVTALATGTSITSLTDTQLNLSSLIIALVIAAAFVLFWARWPNPHRVRRAGDRYAQRLVDAASELS
jgi:hypothetical protein